MRLNIFEWIAIILLIIGGLNWGLIGLFKFDLVAYIFGGLTTFARIIYTLVGIAALYVVALLVPKFCKK